MKENKDLAKIPHSSSGKADEKSSVIKMIDPLSLPKKKTVIHSETIVTAEKEKKLPLFYERKIKGRKFDLF